MTFRVRRLIGLGLAPLLAACTSTIKVPEIPLLDSPAFGAATPLPEPSKPIQYVEVPKPLPLPGQLKPVRDRIDKPKDDAAPKDRVTAANSTARIEPVKDGYINAIQVYPYTKGALYQVYTAVSQVTDIALEAGERLVAVSAGDTVRWVVGDTTSGDGAGAQVHILVKPIGADLETNLVVTTDRRTYHLELRSSEKTYMASVSAISPAPPSPTPASNWTSCGFAIGSRATPRGSHVTSSMTVPKSTFSFQPGSRKAKRRHCLSLAPTPNRRWSTIACAAPPTSSTGCLPPPNCALAPRPSRLSALSGRMPFGGRSGHDP
jgi:Conjugal transfer protein